MITRLETCAAGACGNPHQRLTASSPAGCLEWVAGTNAQHTVVADAGVLCKPNADVTSASPLPVALSLYSQGRGGPARHAGAHVALPCLHARIARARSALAPPPAVCSSRVHVWGCAARRAEGGKRSQRARRVATRRLRRRRSRPRAVHPVHPLTTHMRASWVARAAEAGKRATGAAGAGDEPVPPQALDNVQRPYTTPPGWKPPTLGEQWRYVSRAACSALVVARRKTRCPAAPDAPTPPPPPAPRPPPPGGAAAPLLSLRVLCSDRAGPGWMVGSSF